MARGIKGIPWGSGLKTIFFSDAHLGRKDDENKKALARFIRDTCMDADNVFILGDLFEFYHGYKDYIYPWYIEIIELFKELTLSGKKVYFIEGNHEFDMGEYISQYSGIECCKEITIDIDGRKTYIGHGYEVSGGWLVRLLKSGPAIGMMDLLGPSITWKVASIASLFLSDKRKVFNEKVKMRFRSYAKRKLTEGYDVVILAHSHMPDMVTYDLPGGKIKYYLNTGDIIKGPTYIEYVTGSGFMLKQYLHPMKERPL